MIFSLKKLIAETSAAEPAFVEVTLADLDDFEPTLEFSPKVRERYEADTRQERIAHLRKAICIGLIFYNTYNLTNLMLMPDVGALGLTLRLLMVTPISLMIAWLVGSVPGRLRETLVTAGMVNAIAVPVFLFWISSEPTSLYTVAEFPMTMIFGCMMIILRFRQTLYFVFIAFMMVLVAISTKSGISPVLSFAFSLQIFAACMFVLYGNYKIEVTRQLTYVRTLREVLRSSQLRRDHQVLTKLSNTDPLTGIPNRRHLDERLSTLYYIRRHQPSTIVLMMIDVDYFKLFNDTYGHLVGDHCLIEVAGSLMKGLRTDTDVLARYGGEEFAILLRNGHEQAALDIADRLRAGIEKLGIPHTGRTDGLSVVTISIGAFIVRMGQEWTIERLISTADQALYSAKKQGRNRCVILRDAGAPASPETPPLPLSTDVERLDT